MATSDPVRLDGAGADREPGLELRGVFGRTVLDRDETRSGRVEDLLFATRHAADGHVELVLEKLATGPLAGPMPNWLRAVATLWYRLLGVRDPKPSLVDWSHVAYIDVAVHLDLRRGDAGIDQVERSVERWLGRIPGA